MKNIIFRLGLLVTLFGFVCFGYFRLASAYEPEIRHTDAYYRYRYQDIKKHIEEAEREKELLNKEIEFSKLGVEYDNQLDRTFAEENAHDFLASILKEKRENELRQYFYDRWGIRGYMSEYYLKVYMRRTNQYNKADLLKNKEALKEYIEQSYNLIEK